MRKVLLALTLLLLIQFSDAQNWLREMYNPRVNFFTVQREFNDWWKMNGQEILSDTSKDERGHSEAWRIYKRWEKNVSPLMMARNGNRIGKFNRAEANYYQQHNGQHVQRSTANWSYIGTAVSFDDGGGDLSTGRLNCIRFDPNNRRTLFCGAPSGGLWKSADFGQTWQLLNTDNLAQIGVSDIVINPHNSNTIYIATGDIANSACFSTGVLKSVDGGVTWDTTGLTWTVAQGYLIGRLVMSPLDSNTLLAATNVGVFKTINGGHTWSADTSIYGLTGLELNPLNPNTVYACGIQLYKSVDMGASWHKLSGGLPDSTVSGGFAIAVTPADTNCVYVLVSDTLNQNTYYQPFYGVYQSLNGGNTFNQQSGNPDPSNTGTQGLYDLTIAVSSTNKNQLVMAGVENAWSNDGGLTWNGPNFDSHVDHHDLRFFPGSADTVFSTNDGGLFISTDAGNTWAGLNNGIHIGQLYNVSSSQQTKYLYLTGRQDEGTMYQDTSFEQIVNGGDGLECLIDPYNQNNLFFSSEYGSIVNTPDGGATINNIAYSGGGGGVNGSGSWNTPYALNPQNSQSIFVAKDFVYESQDGGNTFNQLNSPVLNASSYYTQYYSMLAIAPSDSNYIYAGTFFNLYASADGGNTFTDISAGLDTPFFAVAINDRNPKEIWVGTSGPHIYKSLNGGATYTDFSNGLPLNSPFYPQTIAPVKGNTDALYTGLYYAGGVYYRDSTLNQWVPFSNGLPNVSVNQIEVDYCANKIRAATYGRDLWESDPYVPIQQKPGAAANYISSAGTCTDTLRFTDNSTYTPTGWQWYFPGGHPASSTSENPTVVYPGSSTYTATFIATNAQGSDTVQYNITTSICTGINNLGTDNLLQIIPNPNNGNFLISLNNSARGVVNFSVFDNVGRNVYQSSVQKDEDQLTNGFSLAGLSNGVYFVRITSQGYTYVEKLVIGN